MSVPPLQHVLIGTAGHIDHGKTRLVLRLTGTDTDRLPEEKARGISIELGFAAWDAAVETPQGPRTFRFGVVDVPGHERFVRHMVAGATGVNVALLVVAADDGVMPQTREHLEIMDLLGLRIGVVAVTKCDLVEPEYVELVRDEIRELVAGTFLESAPVIAVSSETGAGLPELRAALIEAAACIADAASAEYFRLPIDRVFTLRGHGTIVTGSALSGRVAAGDQLVLMPEGRTVRVRSVEHHGQRGASDEPGGSVAADAGGGLDCSRQRTAVNLAGVKTEEVSRGNELVSPGFFAPTRRLFVSIRVPRTAPTGLADRQHVALHLGTTEVEARLVLRDGPLAPGATGPGELRLASPVVAAWGQRFILRRRSPGLTVGGGTILDPAVPAGERLRDPQELAAGLADPSATERLAAWLARRTFLDEEAPREAVWRVGVASTEYPAALAELRRRGTLVELRAKDRTWLVHGAARDRLAVSVLKSVRAELAAGETPRRSLPRSAVAGVCRRTAKSEIVEALVDHLLATGALVAVGPNIAPADSQVKLTKRQQAALTKLLELHAAAGPAPPTAKESAAAVDLPAEATEALLRLAVEEGALVRVSPDFCFVPTALEELRRTCAARLANGAQATMSELREAWGSTRKYAVPLCEFFDARGATVREGDVRRAGPRIGEPIG